MSVLDVIKFALESNNFVLFLFFKLYLIYFKYNIFKKYNNFNKYLVFIRLRFHPHINLSFL